MTALSTLADRVRPEAPQVPDPLLTRACRDAVIEFYRRTGVARVELAAVDVVADDAEYTLTLPAGFTVAHLRDLRFNDLPLQAVRPDQLDLEWRRDTFAALWCGCSSEVSGDTWRTLTAARPEAYFQPTPDSVRLVPIPNTAAAAALSARAVLVPLQTATSLDDWVYETYAEPLTIGAAARLLRMPGKPWTNQDLAAHYTNEWERLLASAHGDALREHDRNDRQTERVKAWA